MKINKDSLNKKKIVIALAVITITIGGYSAYAMSNSQWPFTSQKQATQESSSATPNSVDDTQDASEASSDADTSTEAPTNSPKTPTENEDTTPLPEDQVSVTITSVNTYDNVVKIKSLIDAITSAGTCTLTMEKGDAIVTKTSGIQPMPGSSTCKGFNIPVSELSEGSWKIKLSVTTGKKAGSASQTYKVQ